MDVKKNYSRMFKLALKIMSEMDGGKKIKIALDKTRLARKIYDAGRLAQVHN